jgi:WD40 repeat protein
MIGTKSREAQNPASCIVRVFGDLRFHTDGDLLALAFARDGTLVSIEEPGILRRWQSNGQQLECHSLSDLETHWSFSRDGRFLASASDDVSLWNVATGELLASVPQPSWVTASAFSEDARYLATGHDDGIVRLWELGKGRLAREFAGHSLPVSAVAFDSSGQRLASAGEDKVVALWALDADDPLGRLVGHQDRIQALLWHPDGRRLISAGWDATARIWDTSAADLAFLLNYHAAQLTALAITADGRLLATADSEQAIYIYDFQADKLRGSLQGHRGPISCLAFSHDSRSLASGGDDRMIHIWDPERTEEGAALYSSLPEQAGFSDGGIALSADGKQVACAAGTLLQTWNTETGKELLKAKQDALVHSLAFSPNGKALAGGTGETAILVWDAATGQIASILKDEDQIAPVTALAFSHDARTLASASATGLEVWLWDLAQTEPRLLIPDALGGCAVECLAFHPQDRWLAVGGIDWLATGGSDGAVCLWDVDERCEIATLDGGSKAVAFDPSGKRLASATLSRSICVWDVESRTLALELIGHDDTVNCLAYAPDGKLIASGSDDRNICLWDAATGKLVATAGLNTQIKALLFSPDGRFLYTGNANLTCYQLDMRKILGK